jgi:hypothetical protein
VRLGGKVVRFRLSPEGKIALKGLFVKSSLQALVAEVDELGAWILLDPAGPAMLLKWDYFAIAVVEYEPEPIPTMKVAGFVQRTRAGKVKR